MWPIPNEDLSPWAALLAAMYEPVELEPPPGGFAYRLVSRPAFHATTLVRIDGRAEFWQLTGKMMSSRFGRVFELEWLRQRVLRPREREAVARLLVELNLWTMPATDDVRGLDGDMWTLEGKDGGRRHIIQRWCPQGRLPTLATLGRYMRMLARVPDDSRVRRMGGQQRRADLARTRKRKRQAAEREMLHLEEMARRNVLANDLAIDLETHGLTCPHCKRHSRDMRYVQGRPDIEWFFICRSCGCSFSPWDRLARDL
jgi:hypothetical protein